MESNQDYFMPIGMVNAESWCYWVEKSEGAITSVSDRIVGNKNLLTLNSPKSIAWCPSGRSPVIGTFSTYNLTVDDGEGGIGGSLATHYGMYARLSNKTTRFMGLNTWENTIARDLYTSQPAKLSQVKKPSNNISLGETCQNASTSYEFGRFYVTEAAQISPRHNGKVNLLYADGHVSDTPRQKLVTWIADNVSKYYVSYGNNDSGLFP